MNPSQQQLNVLTKTRIKMKRAPDLKTTLDEMARGVLSFVIIGYLEGLIIEGDNWRAVRMPELKK